MKPNNEDKYAAHRPNTGVAMLAVAASSGGITLQFLPHSRAQARMKLEHWCAKSGGHHDAYLQHNDRWRQVVYGCPFDIHPWMPYTSKAQGCLSGTSALGLLACPALTGRPSESRCQHTRRTGRSTPSS